MNVLRVPPAFFEVSYVAKRIPGSNDQDDLSLGANCQLFAYSLLRHFGKSIPPFRSSELFEDNTYTHQVQNFEPLDLMLYHHKKEAYGAHIGLYLGAGKVIHLAKALGKPEVRQHIDFNQLERCRYFIGAKRLL